MNEAVVLKPGKETIVERRHHWIFSGAIASYPPAYSEGELIAIKSFDGRTLGTGFFKCNGSLAGRVVSFEPGCPYASLERSLDAALKRRASLLQPFDTSACRLIHGEGDGLPGLIVDRYGPYLVVQTGALGMRKLLPWWIKALCARLPLKGIYEKSQGTSLKEEGLAPHEGVLWGSLPDSLEIQEQGRRFYVTIREGQKTGFFLDQREMRTWVETLAAGRRVLNGFCYTGGFTVAALKGGAVAVDSVDISTAALELCQKNVALNGYPLNSSSLPLGFYKRDLFEKLLEENCSYDFVILDPPACAHRRQDLPAALRGYRRLLHQVMQGLAQESLLLISSCSYPLSEEMLEELVQQAALKNRREVYLLGRHRLASDHPVNLFHPESSYLKSLLISIK